MPNLQAQIDQSALFDNFLEHPTKFGQIEYINQFAHAS